MIWQLYPKIINRGKAKSRSSEEAAALNFYLD